MRSKSKQNSEEVGEPKQIWGWTWKRVEGDGGKTREMDTTYSRFFKLSIETNFAKIQYYQRMGLCLLAGGGGGCLGLPPGRGWRG